MARYVVPMKARPAGGGRPRTLGGFELILLPSVTENIFEIDPAAGTVTCTPKTWASVKDSQEALGMFTHEKAEAVRTMRTVMYDVSAYATAADPKRTVAPPPMGITLLCRDLQRLVGDMSAADVNDPAALADMAKRYGRMRDTMATLRVAFTEAEGSFETVQMLLVQKMGMND